MPGGAGESQLESLDTLVTALAACETAAEIGDRLVDDAVELLDADAAVVCVPEDGVLSPLAVHADRLTEGSLLGTDDGIAGRTHTEDRTIVVDDLASSSVTRDTVYRSVVSTPLCDGVFQVLAVRPAAFSRHDQRLVEHLATVVDQALRRVDREAELDQEHERAASLFHNLADPTLRYTSEDGIPVVAEVNSAFVSTFGYRSESVVGRAVTDVVVPDGANSPPESRPNSLDCETIVEREVDRLTDEGVRPFLLRRVSIDAAERSGYFIYTDIAELKRREERLERQNERLERFASVVSHDLRNPLNVASGFLDHAETADGGEREEAIQRVQDAHQRMANVIEDVLTLARQDEHAEEPEPVALADAARLAWQSVATGRATLDVTTNRTVFADPSRLSRLLENLIRNGVEHSSTGNQNTLRAGDGAEHGLSADSDEPPVHIEIGSFDGGFYVADDGPGIPPGDREAVLEPGHSSDPSGTGLGLAIVDEIADAHGWQVRVTESESGGARFDVLTGHQDGGDRHAS